MQRAFWYGVGCYLILASIAGVGKFFGAIGEIRSLWPEALVGFFLMLFCIPFSIGTIRTARRAPPHTSAVRAIVGWLLGFSFVAILMIVVAILLAILQRWY